MRERWDTVSLVFVSIVRIPDIEDLHLKKVGVATVRGFVKVGDYLQTPKVIRYTCKIKGENR